MLASGSALLIALGVLQADAQFAAGASFESRGGEAPSFTSPNQEQFQVIVAATPLFSVRLLDEASDFTAGSATRIFWRPAPYPDRRPLFLEALEINHVLRLSKRATWQYTLRTSYGEEDYLILAQQLNNQPTLPPQLTLLSLSGTSIATWRASRQATLLVEVMASHRRSTDNTAQPSAAGTSFNFFPPQTVVSVAPGARYRLTRRSLLELRAVVSDSDTRDITVSNTILRPSFESNPTQESGLGDLNIFTIQPELALTYDLTRYHRVRLMAGLAFAKALKELNGMKVDPVYPIFQVDLNSLLDSARGGPVWRSTLSAGTLWYSDPVLGVAVSRAFVQAALNTEINRAWSVGARASFTTDITNVQQQTQGRFNTSSGLVLDETLVSLDLPVRYRSSSRLVAEFGGSFAERGPYLDSHFEFRRNSRELWLFLNLTARTAPPRALSRM